MEYRVLTAAYDSSLADLIRRNLEKHNLNIPGTAYFDEGLDHLSLFYGADPLSRFYLILTDGDEVIGGIGLAKCDGFPNCAELQKLYLADRVKGHGLGYELIRRIEEKARELGYERMYLETHTSLEAAIHIYEKAGYTRIEKPETVVHSTMNRFYLKQL